MSNKSSKLQVPVLVAPESLDELRTNIDDIDQQLLRLLGRRMLCAQEIGLYKKKHKLPVVQNARWQELLDKVVQQGVKFDLSETFIVAFMNAIHDESIRHQTRIVQS
jgi:chorismate mutase